MENDLLNAAGAQLQIAEVLPKHRHHKEGEAVISRLLKEGSLSRMEFTSLTGSDIGRKLLAKNVFSFSYGTGRVTFQSTLMKRFCEKRPDEWKDE
jgi:hypothetical protein